MNNKEEIVLGYLEQTEDVSNTEDEVPSFSNSLPLFYASEDKFKPIKCLQCENIMKLLIQIYAPISKEHASHRSMYVFICLNEKCCIRNSSVRVFRMQKNQKPQLIKSQIKEYLLSESSKAFSIETEIISAKENNNELQIAEELLPTNLEDDDKDVDLKNVKFEKENQIIDKFMKSGEEKEDIEEMEGLEQNEQNNTDGCFLIYQHFLTQFQNHVVRYCFDKESKPLWFSDKKQPSLDSTCAICKKKKIFEFQINNSILTLFPELYNMEWGALYVYSCPNSCQAGDQLLIEESIFAHSDEQEFISPNLKVDPQTKLVTIEQEQSKKKQQQKQQNTQQIQQEIEKPIEENQEEEDDW